MIDSTVRGLAVPVPPKRTLGQSLLIVGKNFLLALKIAET
jgi:hypothetical protein